jgi:broad-specificity NMP kinase
MKSVRTGVERWLQPRQLTTEGRSRWAGDEVAEAAEAEVVGVAAAEAEEEAAAAVVVATIVRTDPIVKAVARAAAVKVAAVA